jgi:hypothetical protein
VIFHLERFLIIDGIHFVYHSLSSGKTYLFRLSIALTIAFDGTSYVLYLFKLWEAFFYVVCVCP